MASALRTQMAAARLLRTTSSRLATLSPAQQRHHHHHQQQRRFKTNDSKTALTEHGEVHPATRPINSPDYGVHIDNATSYVVSLPEGTERKKRKRTGAGLLTNSVSQHLHPRAEAGNGR